MELNEIKNEIKIENRNFEEQKVMYVKVKLKHEQMFDTAPFFMKIGLHLFKTDGRGPGFSFVRLVAADEEYVELEICIEVEELVEESDDKSIKAAIIPAFSGKYAVGIHKGARHKIEDIGASYSNMQKYIKDNNLKHSGEPIIQLNLNNVHQVPEEDLLTELLFPIK